MVAVSEKRRSGGRKARVEARSQPIERDERPVRPGLPGGSYRPLSDSDLGKIVETAFDLLENVGIADAIPDFIADVKPGGGWVDDNGRLRLPRKLVQKAIDDAAKEYTLHGFTPEHDIQVGGNRVHFGTAGAAVLFLEPGSRSFRPSELLDLYDLARVADKSDNLHFFGRTCVARDMETPRELDLNTAYACMMGTSKPIATSFFQPDHVHEAVRMFDVARGGPGKFREKPFCAMLCTFVVPPLRFAEESCECIVAAVDEGLPIALISAGQAGATSPTPLAGSVTQALTECLAVITCINSRRPGHPCTVGMWPFVSDLRTGAMSGGSGEEALLNAASAQVLNYIGLPSGVAAGMTDSKLPDNQAGYEKGMTVTLAAQAGANMIFESASMLGSLMASSIESLAIDNDMLGGINRTIRGIEVNQDTLARQVMADVVLGDGHFLGHDQTLGMMQSEYIYPIIGDRLSPKDWEEAGSVGIREKARWRLDDILQAHPSEHVSREVDAEIRRQFPIRLPLEEVTGRSIRHK